MGPGSATFPALGTTCLVCVRDAAALGDAVEIVERRLAALDLACSRFRADSELSELNRTAGTRFQASRLLFEAVAVAIAAAEQTGGAVDPTVGRAVSGLGWDRDYTAVVTRAERPVIEVVPAAGWRAIQTDRSRGTVQIPSGVTLDLGATAKAWAADRCAAAVARATGCGTLVSLGGDVAVAGLAPARGWPIQVTDDHRGGEGSDQTVAIFAGGLATSSTMVRRWRAGGAERHHIVDPQSGLPAPEIWRTVSVHAQSCLAANTATTAAIIRGASAPSWLESAGLCGRLVGLDGSVAYTARWPEETP